MSQLAETQRPVEREKDLTMTDDEKELLIGCVRRAKWLWMIKHPSYHDKDKKENGWDAVNRELQGEDRTKWKYDARIEWRKLREYWTCTKRRHKKKSGQAADTEPVWKFFVSMSFLNDKDCETDMIFDSYDYIDEEALMAGAEAVDDKENSQVNTPEQQPNPTDDDSMSLASGFVGTNGASLGAARSASAQSTPVQSTSAQSTSAQAPSAQSTSAQSTSAQSTSAQSTSAQSTPAQSSSAPLPEVSGLTPAPLSNNSNARTPSLASTPLAAKISAKRPRVLCEEQKKPKQPKENVCAPTNSDIKKELLDHVRSLRNSSEEDAFGFSIGQQLKTLPPSVKIKAMKQIQDIIYDLRVVALDGELSTS